MIVEVSITLDRNEILYCANIGEKRGKYKHKGWQSNKYTKGIQNSDRNPFMTERMGAYGELAFSKFVGGLPLDETVSDTGDRGFDFILNNNKLKLDTKIQWKPAYWAVEKLKYYGPFYVPASDKFGNEKELKADIYFFQTMNYVLRGGETLYRRDIVDNGSDLSATMISIYFYGSIEKGKILENKEERKNKVLWKNDGTASNGYNYYIKEEELLSPLKFRKKYITNGDVIQHV